MLGRLKKMFKENEILKETYQIIKPIGRGGLGVVYLAYHLGLQIPVVVKCILKNFDDNATTRTEADILKELRHSNIPRIYDFFQVGKSYYIVMDYVNGVDLEKYRMAGNRPSEEQIVFWFRQLTEVLVYLEAKSVVHLDIKPSNIMIDSDGNAVLIDFNISSIGDKQNVVGYTIPYASPEQISNARSFAYGHQPNGVLDARSDIYSLGACFYELISGMPPRVEQESPLLTGMDLDISTAFRKVIDTTLCIDRQKRFASAKKMLNAIDRLKHQNRQYRNLLLAQLAILIAGVALVSSGVYCMITGFRKSTNEAFRAAISDVYQKYSSGDADGAQKGCLEVLNSDKYANILDSNAADHYRLLGVLADIAYEQEDYVSAIAFYEKAQPFADTKEAKESGLCNSIMAYAQHGDLGIAQQKLDQISDDGMSNSILLAQIVIYARSGNEQACREETEQLLSQCDNPDICARACAAAANASQDLQSRIKWLEASLSFDPTRNTKRGLVIAYEKHAQETGSLASALSALEYAQQLINEPYARGVDWINYATALQLCGKNDEAIRVLTEQLKDYPNDYRILMNLAYIYDAIDDISNARWYCDKAMDAWKSDTAPDKLAEDSDDIQNMFALRQSLG